MADHLIDNPMDCVDAATPAEDLFVDIFTEAFGLEKTQSPRTYLRIV